MSEFYANPFSERPIRSSEEDILDRGTFVRRIAQALVSPNSNQATGSVIGICGEWGSGKSSVLSLLAEHLEKSGALVVLFDPWLISKRDDLVRRLLIELERRIDLHFGKDRTIKEKLKKIKAALSDYRDEVSLASDLAATGLSGGIPIPGIGRILTAPMRKKSNEGLSLESQKELLNRKLSQLNIPIVILVDELDRLEDHEIRIIAQLVRAVANFPQISYLLSYDSERISEALGVDAGPDRIERIARGRGYLEKIVQYQIPLPIILNNDLLSIAETLITHTERDLALPVDWKNNQRFVRLLKIVIPGLLRTPRDIKRWIGMAHVQGLMFNNEVDWIDIFGWAVILTKAPQTAANIRSKPNRVSYGVDHGELEGEWAWLSDEKKSPESLVTDISHPSERCPGLSSLLAFLFPRLAGEKHPSFEHDRIFNARPLLTVLNNGLPPGHFSRSEIETILKSGGAAFAKALKSSIEKNTLQAFLIRFYEIYPYLPDLNHIDIWVSAAKVVHKSDNKWQSKFYPYHHIGNDLLDAFETRVKLDKEFGDKIAHPLVKRLDAINDWELLPGIIFNHIWAHGLFGTQKREGRAVCFTASETESLSRDMVRKLKDEFHNNPFFIANLWSLIPFYIATWMKEWSDTDRIRMNTLLSDPGMIDTLTLLQFGGKFTSTKNSIDELIGFEVFRSAAQKRYDKIKSDMDPSLQAAYWKFLESGIPSD